MTSTRSSEDAAATGARQLVRSAVRGHWRSLSAGGFGAVLITAADLAAPFPLAWVIDKLLIDREAPFSFTSSDIRLLAILVQAVVVIAILAAAGQYLADVSLQRAGEQITHDLRIRIYGHLQRLSLAFHDTRSKGDLVTRLTGDVNAVGTLFSAVIGNIVQAGLVLIGMVGVTLFLDPILAIVLYGAIPLLFVVTRSFRRRIRVAARDQRKAEARIASLANESLSAIRVVKAFGTEEYEHDRVSGHSDERRKVGVVAASLDAKFGGIVDVLGALTIATVLAVGAVRVSHGAITVGGLVIFLHYARRVYRPLRDIAKYSTAASRAMARAERIADVLAADETVVDPPGGYSGPRANGAVRLEGVTFGYDSGRPVIAGVDLDLAPGSVVAVVGPSGAGKSTIGALVARFYDPESGRVLIDGRDARECSVGWLREQVGFLLQDTILFSGTIAENIGYGVDATTEQIVAAARLADAHEFIESLPEGYDTMLGPQGVGLSGGQRQRIGVARVILRDPPILVLDEPTTGLDATSEAQLMDGLGGLMTGRSCILITHSLALASRAERVVVIADGRVSQQGKPDELLQTPGSFRKLATLQGLTGRRRPPMPASDPEVPQLRHLLDLDTVAGALEQSLGDGGQIDDVVVDDVRYRPGVQATVTYAATIDGVGHSAVVTTGPDARAAAGAAANLDLARRVNGRSPARSPLSFDERLGAMIQWLPLDVALPVTALRPDELHAVLRSAGVGPPTPGAVEPLRVAHRPGRSITMDVAGVRATAWARDADLARALRSLEFAVAVGLIEGHPISGAAREHGLSLAPRPNGHVIDEPVVSARAAGRALARLHQLPGPQLEAVLPVRELMAVNRAAGLVGALCPDLQERLEALVAVIIEIGPRAGDLDWTTSHGRFHAAALVVSEATVAPSGWDAIVRAPAARDIASYVADVSDRLGTEAADESLHALVDGYGTSPAALSWYLATALLVRADGAFRRQEPDWPAGVERMVRNAEALLV